MQTLGKVWILCMLSSAFAWSASVRATVNTIEVVQGNPVQLFLKAKGGSAEFPQITMIVDVPVVGQSTSSSRNLSMVNGSVTSEQSTTKILQFIPQKDMTIPSYTVNINGKEYKTDPIDIKVVKAYAASAQKNALFSLEMRTSKNKVILGESFMVTVDFALKNGVRLSQGVQYVKPEFPGFTAVDIEEEKVYQKGNYQVQEIRYMLTAQEEGNLTIAPARAKVGIPDRSRRDIFGINFATKWHQAISNSLKIEVLAQAQESDMVGEFTVATTIDTQEVKANQPVNFTVSIEGKGNLENFEFPEYEIDAVTVYSGEAKVDVKIVDAELYSIYSKTFAFISDADFSIPSRDFSMLTIVDNTVKTLHVKGYDIKVKATQSLVSSTVNNEPKQALVQTNIPHAVKTKEVIVEKEVEVKSVAWWMLVLAFVFGSAVTYGIPKIPKLKAKPYKESEALKILYAHMSDDPKVEDMVRKLYAKKNGDKSVQIDKKELKEMVERFLE